MAIRLTDGDERRFANFVKDLEKISMKHGVAIHSTGGVSIFSDNYKNEVESIEYTDDPSSGDISWDTVLKPNVEKAGYGKKIESSNILKKYYKL